MRKSLITAAFGLAMLSFSTAHAQGAQGYIGGGLGWTNISVDCGAWEQCDKSGTGGKLYGGYRFSNQFAVEAVYIDWGKFTASGTETVLARSGLATHLQTTPLTVAANVELKPKGLGLGVAYFAPFSAAWNGVARLGVMQMDGKLEVGGTAKGVSVSLSESKKSTFAYFGFGVGYQLMPNLAVTGEADFSRVKYGIEGEYETDNVRLISIGLRYSF